MKLDLKYTDMKPTEAMIGVTRDAFASAFTQLGLKGCSETLEATFTKNFSTPCGQTVKIPTGCAFIDAEKRDPMEMTLAPAGAHQIIPAVCHEMVHVDDIIRGRFVLDTTRQGIHYDGTFIPKLALLRSKDMKMDKFVMLHEQRPYDEMYPMAIRAFNSMPASAQEFVKRNCRDKYFPSDPVGLWRDYHERRKKALGSIKADALKAGCDWDKLLRLDPEQMRLARNFAIEDVSRKTGEVKAKYNLGQMYAP